VHNTIRITALSAQIEAKNKSISDHLNSYGKRSIEVKSNVVVQPRREVMREEAMKPKHRPSRAAVSTNEHQSSNKHARHSSNRAAIRGKSKQTKHA
jgi:hypothetical protein